MRIMEFVILPHHNDDEELSEMLRHHPLEDDEEYLTAENLKFIEGANGIALCELFDIDDF